MTNLTTEEMQRIVDGAPEGATHVDCDVDYYKINKEVTEISTPAGNWLESDCLQFCSDIIRLSDLRTILAQQQEIEELKEELSTAIEIIEDSGIDYDEVIEAKGESDE